jgi:hypothetical protein
MNPIRRAASGSADVIGLNDCADRLAGDGELMRQMKHQNSGAKYNGGNGV